MKNSETIGLTPAQRLHFDIYGFVLLENVLNDDEIERMKGALYRMKADEDLDAKRVYARWGKANIMCFSAILLRMIQHS